MENIFKVQKMKKKHKIYQNHYRFQKEEIFSIIVEIDGKKNE